MARRDYDVIVVGAGAAGLTPAIAAADAGAGVLLVEADTRLGGSSRLSGGHFYAAGTSLQAKAGVDDSADAMFEALFQQRHNRVGDVKLLRPMEDLVNEVLSPLYAVFM